MCAACVQYKLGKLSKREARFNIIEILEGEHDDEVFQQLMTPPDDQDAPDTDNRLD